MFAQCFPYMIHSFAPFCSSSARHNQIKKPERIGFDFKCVSVLCSFKCRRWHCAFTMGCDWWKLMITKDIMLGEHNELERWRTVQYAAYICTTFLTGTSREGGHIYFPLHVLLWYPTMTLTLCHIGICMHTALCVSARERVCENWCVCVRVCVFTISA